MLAKGMHQIPQIEFHDALVSLKIQLQIYRR